MSQLSKPISVLILLLAGVFCWWFSYVDRAGLRSPVGLSGSGLSSSETTNQMGQQGDRLSDDHARFTAQEQSKPSFRRRSITMVESEAASDDVEEKEFRLIDTPWRPRSQSLPSRDEFPMWNVPRGFQSDVFTFVRIQYDAYGPFGWWDRWDNDYPDGDWNFSFRLQEITSIRTDPYGRAIRLTDPELFDYPFVYMAGPQYLRLNTEEVKAFRRYLQSGGFVMMDDFWTQAAWTNVVREMRRVLPQSKPVELTIDHPIFHTVYDLKELPQVTDLRTWEMGYKYEYMHSGGLGDMKPHYWAYHDEQGRLVALCCHNNDIGDGWEREGQNRQYFELFSVKKSYPLGINILAYIMTH
ncbi:MAG: DUF4159 domain-containing protein [Planctomycetota bacterium]